MGERAPPNELMAWNADATRMPYRMHSEYLRKLFLDNDLAEGATRRGQAGRAVRHSCPDVRGRHHADHVAPWRSVYKIHYQVDADVTFLLTSGGHNAGVVAPPDEPGHSYQVLKQGCGRPYVGPDEWLKLAPRSKGRGGRNGPNGWRRAPARPAIRRRSDWAGDGDDCPMRRETTSTPRGDPESMEASGLRLRIRRKVRGAERLGFVQFPVGVRSDPQQFLFPLAIAEANGPPRGRPRSRMPQGSTSHIVVQLSERLCALRNCLRIDFCFRQRSSVNRSSRDSIE